MTDLRADVVIVGSGVAGALIAAKLAQQGVKVIVLEAGPRIDRVEAVERFFSAPVKVPECAYPQGPEIPHPVTNKLDGWFRQTGPDFFKSTYIKAVGGTTWHWLGTCLRLLPADFVMRSRYGRAADWPISYDQLEPFYGQAEQEIGVAGDSNEALGAPRSRPYPMPPIPPTYLDKGFAAALVGTEFQVRSTPQGRNSTMRDDRPACCGNSSCIPVCPVQAKYDATVHVARAEQSGAVIVDKANAVAVVLGADQTVDHIAFKRWDLTEGRVFGRVFVLAAHAIETPRLLLASASEKAPRGVANGSDQVGRNLMDHPTQLSWALAKDPLYPYRGPLSTSGIENLRDGAFRKDRGAFRIEIGNDGWLWAEAAPVSTAAALAKKGLSGKALDTALTDQLSRQIRLASLVEELPDPANRITLDPVARDMYGVPGPQIAYRISDYVKNGLAEARAAHTKIFGRLSATMIQHTPEPEGAGHILGTAVMGADPARSVVDPELRCHQHKNLFIAGSAVFPTGGTANPTLTIAALSLRLADTIAVQLKR